MDRRTFLKSASMKGTAIVTASAVGTGWNYCTGYSDFTVDSACTKY